jgi:uncharacterized iron-regulated membrane protein
MQPICKKMNAEFPLENSRADVSASATVVPLEPPAKLCLSARRRPWVRRVHAALGIVSALNLFVLITTGFLLQHSALLKLDERSLTRKILPSGYRPQDVGSGVRADIVVADLHSGRMFGVAGALFLDAVTLVWLVMLATGVVMYLFKQRVNGKAPDRGACEECPEENN